MKKKRIGIISLYYHNYNFGGMLQSYALQQFVSNMGVECEQICYDSEITARGIRLDRIKNTKGKNKIKSILSLMKYDLYEFIDYLETRKIRSNLLQRREIFKNFEKVIGHSERVYDYETIVEAANEYDGFICGSDVIWNAGIPAFVSCLGFVPDDKVKIAYAPSLGTGKIPEYWPSEYLTYVKRLDAVSVREKIIKEQLESMVDNVENTVDPTFLLSASEWDEVLCDGTERKEKKYILCYLLGADRQQREFVTSLANKYGLELITFPHIVSGKYRACDSNFGTEPNYTSGPKEFVALIKNAELVFTDSFHAIVFSMLFHTKFWALSRKDGKNVQNLNGRVENLLTEYGLEDRKLYDLGIFVDYMMDIDYKEIDDAIEKNRQESIDFLSKAMRGYL